MNFCCFDFSGAGMSKGEYVSMGFYERFDILAVLKQIVKKFQVKKFYLWGRSMGAAAAILFMSTIFHPSQREKYQIDFQIEGLILDSPFQSLPELSLHIAKQKIKMPEFILKAALKLIQSTILQKAGFKISDMQMLPHVKNINCPVLLLASKDDKLVELSHSEKIYNAIQHRDRQICYIRGEHNSNRDQEAINNVIDFVIQIFQRKKVRGKEMTRSTKLLNYKQNFNGIVPVSPTYSMSPSNHELQSYKMINKSVSYEQKNIISGFNHQKIVKNNQIQGKCETQNDEDYPPNHPQKYNKNDKNVKDIRSGEFRRVIQMFSPGFGSHKKMKESIENKQMYFRSAQQVKNINVSFEERFQPEMKIQMKVQGKQLMDMSLKSNVHHNSQNLIKISDTNSNKSPTKQPPKLTSLNKYSVKFRENSSSLTKPIFQTPSKPPLPHPQTQKYKQLKRQFTDCLACSDNQQQGGHFNVITQKLKKTKLKGQKKLEISDKFQQIQGRASMGPRGQRVGDRDKEAQREAQLGIKMPPGGTPRGPG